MKAFAFVGVLRRQALHGLPRSAPIASGQLAWPPTKVLSRFGNQYFVHEDLVKRAMVLIPSRCS